MRYEDLTQEQLERARECKTDEERKAFIEEVGTELSDEQLEGVSGGSIFEPECPRAPKGRHVLVHTGRTRPGKIWGDDWPDYEFRCTVCGYTEWHWTPSSGTE